MINSDVSNYIKLTADAMEGSIGGCAMDDLRDDSRYFPEPPDPYDITWYLSKELTTRKDRRSGEKRFALGVHRDQKFLLDLDDYEERINNDDELDGLWKKL